ncbi:hypothetical protein SAMN04489723_1104 [Algoriphagus aquimarinus]|uniref:Uncharacterized protein n=1 Tax=Algoriphagus aquimarinus TaxID=237018 RepID=A0A1I1AYF1_9BACT|nr:hypothetical protein SAMN04489723_1104 [Algoriphagus aquimarinus]
MKNIPIKVGAKDFSPLRNDADPKSNIRNQKPFHSLLSVSAGFTNAALIA